MFGARFDARTFLSPSSIRSLMRTSFLTAIAAGALLSAPAAAQQPAAAGGQPAAPTSGYRAELIRDLNTLERRYMALATAMSGKYGWRPGEGVRSVGEVFMHVAGANFALPLMAGVQPPAEKFAARDMKGAFEMMGQWEKVTDEAKVKEALAGSFQHARDAVARTPDASLDEMTKFFGQDATKRAVLQALVTHLHEHLGQSIAYARSNGVVPPWSASGGD
jgi:uncharacterized damage-inducible protein DinB